MPCDTKRGLDAQQKQRMTDALARLEAALAGGAVALVIGRQGAIAFRGWKEEDRAGLSDLCAYRRLSSANSPALRRALARAEAQAGMKIDQRALAAGVHSHDGGRTWGQH